MTKTKKQLENHKLLERIIWYNTVHRGYKLPSLERAIFKTSGMEPLKGSLDTWAKGVILNADFARAFFGDDPVDNYNHSMLAIKLWAKQVAYEFQGKIYAARDGERERAFLEIPEIDFNYTYDKAVATAPSELIDVHKVVLELKNLAGMIPFHTHQLEDADIIGLIPSWQYHLQQAVIADNPYQYMFDYIDDHGKFRV